MGHTDCIALPRGAGDGAVGRRTLLVAAVLTTIVLGAAAVLVRALAPTTAGTSATAGLSLNATPTELAASRAAGARDRGFWAVHRSGALLTENPGQHLQASFTRSGVNVSVPYGSVGLSLRALGRGTRLSPVGAPAPGLHANQVAYARGALSEWYANGPLGLEQGLRLSARPAPGPGGELTFAYQLSGGSRATLHHGVLSLLSANGTPMLVYGGLRASDALGRALPARLALSGSQLLIRVDDAGARYPLSIDPLIQTAALTGFARNIMRALGPASLAVVSSTAISLSVEALNSKGKPWSTADEGVGEAVSAKVTITNPAGTPYGTATSVRPAALGVSPSTTLAATGGPTPPVPSAGYTLAPGASASFTVPYKILTPGDATVSDSVTWHDQYYQEGPTSGMTTVPLGSAVKGTVYNLSCGSGGSTGCSRAGVGGATILAKGTASDGSAVVHTATSQSNGTYTLGVPAGGYTVGSTEDGKTIDGAGFDPLDRAAVVPAAAPLTGQDFSACALDKKLGTAGDRRSAAAADPVLAHAAAAATPTACKSIYTIKVSAKIPQGHLVDPSTKAAYQEHGGAGYNPSSHHSHPTGFPACFSDSKVQQLSQAGATAEWYSYIQGGKLGSATASFLWDRKAQEVHLVDGPTVSVQKLTRIFVWRVDDHGTITKGTCPETNHVEMLTLPVGGSDLGSGKLSGREFALMTVWGFPFEPTGERVDPDSLLERGRNILKNIYSYVQAFDTAVERTVGTIIPFYKSFPSLIRFGIEFAASSYLGTKFVHALAAAPGAIVRFVSSAKYLPQVLAELKAAAELSHGLHLIGHGGHRTKQAQEVIAYLAGFAGKGEYPVMGAVIRGRFLATGYKTLDLGSGQTKFVPTGSALALAAKTTKFPTISIQVSRQAAANSDPNNPVKTGPLPWTTQSSPQLDVSNQLGHNPTNEITNAAAHHYGIGIHGVHEVHADTSQTPELTKAVEEHAEEFTDFNVELDEADVPDCTGGGLFPALGSFLCYKFNDGRP